jgi:prenyltransferase beta subunit
MQDSQDGGWAERVGDSASSLNTAEVLLALACVRDSLPPAGAKIRRAVQFLEGQQTQAGEEAGSWPRYVKGEPSCPDLLRTSLAIEALARVSEAEPNRAVEPGVRWLLNRQGEDGGWGARAGAESDLLMTCFATTALLGVADGELFPCEEPIRRALAFLAAAQRPSGSFDPEESTCAIRTAHAALCLQRAERCGLNTHLRERQAAIEWLEEHPVAAIKEVELTIEIDPDRTRRQADYAFVFMTEAVVARLLSESPDQEVRTGRLAREALEAIFRGMDPTGAFFGQRVFSWSTARATYALGAAQKNFEQFPEAPRLPPPRQVGRELLGFAALILAAVIVLSLFGVFGLLQAVVVMFLLLALLLAYGRISEAGFLQAFKALWSRSRNPS